MHEHMDRRQQKQQPTEQAQSDTNHFVPQATTRPASERSTQTNLYSTIRRHATHLGCRQTNLLPYLAGSTNNQHLGVLQGRQVGLETLTQAGVAKRKEQHQYSLVRLHGSDFSPGTGVLTVVSASTGVNCKSSGTCLAQTNAKSVVFTKA